MKQTAHTRDIEINIYIYTHTYTYIYTWTCIYTYTYTHMHVHIHTHTCIHIYVYIYVHIRIHTYMYIYIYTYTYAHAHIYIYIYIYHIYTSCRERGTSVYADVHNIYLTYTPAHAWCATTPVNACRLCAKNCIWTRVCVPIQLCCSFFPMEAIANLS